jgi:hypothetical protein
VTCGFVRRRRSAGGPDAAPRTVSSSGLNSHAQCAGEVIEISAGDRLDARRSCDGVAASGGTPKGGRHASSAIPVPAALSDRGWRVSQYFSPRSEHLSLGVAPSARRSRAWEGRRQHGGVRCAGGRRASPGDGGGNAAVPQHRAGVAINLADGDFAAAVRNHRRRGVDVISVVGGRPRAESLRSRRRRSY